MTAFSVPELTCRFTTSSTREGQNVRHKAMLMVSKIILHHSQPEVTAYLLPNSPLGEVLHDDYPLPTHGPQSSNFGRFPAPFGHGHVSDDSLLLIYCEDIVAILERDF